MGCRFVIKRKLSKGGQVQGCSDGGGGEKKAWGGTSLGKEAGLTDNRRWGKKVKGQK